MHGFAFEKVFGGEGVACTEGDLVANKDKLGGSIEEEHLTTILLEGRFQPLCGAQSAMDTGLILVHKDLLAGLQNIVRELVLLPRIHVEGAASVPGPSAGFFEARQVGVEHESTCGCFGRRHGVQEEQFVAGAVEIMTSSSVGHQ